MADALRALPADKPPSVSEAMDELHSQLAGPPIRKASSEKVVPLNIPETVDINSPAAAEIMGRLQEQIAQLREQVSGLQQAGTGGGVVETGPSGYPWQYYRRAPQGVQAEWIVYGPGGANPKGQRDSGSYVHYMTKGMKPITGYGNLEPPSAYKLPGEPYVPMLERGGAREFPAAQVLAYKWHLTPPLEGVLFPQYEAVKDKARQFVCEDCEFNIWMLDDDTETGMACFRHLRADTQDGRHSYSRREATAILMEQKLPFSAGRFAALAEELRKMDISGNAEELQSTAQSLKE